MRLKKGFNVQIHHPSYLPAKTSKEAAKWYNDQKPGLGEKFTATVRNKVRYIRKNPKAVAIRYEDTKTTLLDTFPYMVHFVVDDSKKLVIVSAVLSTHRNPEIWEER